MNKKLKIALTTLVFLISATAAFFMIRVMANSDAIKADDVALQNSIVDPFVTFSKWLVILTIAVTIIFSLRSLFLNPKQLKKIVISLTFLGALWFVCYFMASDAEVLDATGNILEGGEKGDISKRVSALINYSMSLGAIGILLLILGSVRSLIK